MQIVIDTSELARLARDLGDRSRAVSRGIERGLDAAAIAGRKAVQDEIRARFDRPTPWTVRAVEAKLTQNHNMESIVRLSEDTAKSIPAARALAHQVTGGTRAWKRSEGMLRRIGMLGEGENAVPGKAAKIDAYGNMDRGQVNQILAYFGGFSESGYRANTKAKRKAKLAKGTDVTLGFRYFYKRDRPGRGIYKSTRKIIGGGYVHWTMDPVIIFVRRASYQARLDMAAAVSRVAGPAFSAAFSRAMAARGEG